MRLVATLFVASCGSGGTAERPPLGCNRLRVEHLLEAGQGDGHRLYEQLRLMCSECGAGSGAGNWDEGFGLIKLGVLY